jgi:hypothetical protein
VDQGIPTNQEGGSSVTWFKVDDGLNAHRKVRKLRKSHRSKVRDVSPMGLWVLAGSWCGAHSATGFIASDVLEDWDDDFQILASRLVDAGLWIEATEDGEAGYRFHDWADFAWATASEEGKRGNHVRWHEKKGTVDPECEFCSAIIGATSPPISPPESGEESPPESRTRPDPSRPDPTTTTKTSPVRFEDFWKLYPRKIGKEAAAKAWKAAAKKADPSEIVTALRTQLPSLQMQRRTDGDYRPHPATWLNQGRWADEVDTPRSTKMPEGW